VFRDGVVTFYWLAFILSQLAIQDPEASQSEVIRFGKRYTGPLPSRKWGRSDWILSLHTNLMEYHSLIFSASKDYKHWSSYKSREGIQCHRGQGSLPSLGGEYFTPYTVQ
jgi:hypothetical protein